MGRLKLALPGTIESPRSIEEPIGGGERWKVTVFDNDVNTYEEVIEVLIMATGCCREEAYCEAWEIDHFGKSDVHFGGHEECQGVAKLVGTIGIEVAVSAEN